MNPILFPAPLKIRATYIKIVENKQNVHYLWCHDFLNFDDIFKNDRVRGGLQSVKIKKPPGILYISQYRLLSFRPKSMLDEVNYYFRITLKGKNSLFLTKVIFISVESSNLGIMLKNTTF